VSPDFPSLRRALLIEIWGLSRARHRMGLDQEGHGLYQYVVEDEAKRGANDGARGPRVIQLDDTPFRKPYVLARFRDMFTR
jgi:hypothetical protein